MSNPYPPTRRTFNAAIAAAIAAPTVARLAGAGETVPATRPAVMPRRKLGRSSEEVPVIGMGTWQTFDPHTVDEETLSPLREVFRQFYDAGGRVVDSSPMYGKSQAVTGQLSRELGINADLFMATKVWTTGEEAGVAQMKQSIAELGRERVELMQVHNLLDYKAHLSTLRAWKDAGVARYIGVTDYRASEFDALEKILREDHVDFVQLPYSIAARSAEERLIPAAVDAGVAVLVMRPFEGGSLFRRLMDKPLPAEALGFATSWAQLFLKWIIAHPAVTAVLPATAKPKHMTDNLTAAVGVLPDEATRAAWVKALTT